MPYPLDNRILHLKSQHNLSRQLLDEMIDARELFLHDDVRPPFDSMEDVQAYAEKAFSSVHYLLLECLRSGTDNQEMKGHARHAANQVCNVCFLDSNVSTHHNMKHSWERPKESLLC